MAAIRPGNDFGSDREGTLFKLGRRRREEYD
jgi:hypothetical protein